VADHGGRWSSDRRGERFVLSVGPDTGWAQFGCNAGGGSARVSEGWLSFGGLIITAAGCPGREQFERRGFEILGQLTAIERRGTRLVLRNAKGSLTLEPLAPVPLASTRWTVFNINGHNAPGRGGTLRFGSTDYRAGFGCNELRGTYRQEGAAMISGGSTNSEKGCMSVLPSGVTLDTFENWGFRVMHSRPTVRRLRPRGNRAAVGDRGVDAAGARRLSECRPGEGRDPSGSWGLLFRLIPAVAGMMFG
jgi:heat shock protein HslJ